MIDLSDKLDLISIDGRDDFKKVALSSKALKYSCSKIKFANIKLLATSLPDNYNYEYIKIPTLNLQQYNTFMNKEIHKYMSSEFSLFVQWDGFVIRPDLWDNRFFDYDYIGAPWPPEWTNREGRVGNGGFSLRSRRLMEFVSTIRSDEDNELEDNFICLKNRKLIESNGFKFAPVEIAAKFSWENPIPENIPNNSFGFHGRHTNIHLHHIQLLEG